MSERTLDSRHGAARTSRRAKGARCWSAAASSRIFNLGDRFLATDNRCPHKGGPLCDGIVTGASVVCPLHAWKVNLETGAVERPAHGRDHCVGTYPTRVDDGVVIVRACRRAQRAVEAA